jgi:cyclophilin family peptidyl-prolyl cis-trans isomerase
MILQNAQGPAQEMMGISSKEKVAHFRNKTFLFSLLVTSAVMLAACNPSDLESGTPPPTDLSVSMTNTPESGCSIVQAEPTPALSSSPFAVGEDDFILGDPAAPVTVIQYCDLQSVDCHYLAVILDQLLQNHPDEMRLITRPIPLLETSGFENSQIAVQALIAAEHQGKLPEVYRLLYDKYSDWANLTSTSVFEGWLARESSALEIDVSRFKTDLKSPETIQKMKDWYSLAKEKGVQPPYPLVLINGIPVNVGLLNYDYLDKAVSLIALGTRQFTQCPPVNLDLVRNYVAKLQTEKGEVEIQLFPDRAPLAVNSFIFLARQGWFNGVTFHRVIPGFVAQAGDPSGTGQGGPGYYFKNEIGDLLFDRPGRVGMANSGPDTNGSQFFITYAPAARLDGAYTIFGQVIHGMDVIEQLTPRDPDRMLGLPPGDVILNISIEER